MKGFERPSERPSDPGERDQQKSEQEAQQSSGKDQQDDQQHKAKQSQQIKQPQNQQHDQQQGQVPKEKPKDKGQEGKGKNEAGGPGSHPLKGHQPGHQQHHHENSDGKEKDLQLTYRELIRLIQSVSEGLPQFREEVEELFGDVARLTGALRWLKGGAGGDIYYDPAIAKSERPTEADRRAAMYHAYAGIRSVHILWTEDDEVIVTMDELPPVVMSNKLADLLIALCRGEHVGDPYRTDWFSTLELAPRVGYDASKFDNRMSHNVANLILRLRDAIPNRHLIRTDEEGRYRFLLRQGGEVTIVKWPEGRETAETDRLRGSEPPVA